MENGQWMMDGGRWTSFERLPSGHQGPEHRADLFIARGELLVLVGRDVAAVKSEVKPDPSTGLRARLGFFGLTQGIAEAVLEDGLVPELGKSFSPCAIKEKITVLRPLVNTVLFCYGYIFCHK